MPLEIDCLRKALSLALNRLIKHEPPDSRLVSDEFVAMAAIEAGDYSLKVMNVIDLALIKERENVRSDLERNPPETCSNLP